MSDTHPAIPDRARQLADHLLVLTRELALYGFEENHDDKREVVEWRLQDGPFPLSVEAWPSLERAIRELDEVLTEAEFSPQPVLDDNRFPSGIGLPLGRIPIVLTPRAIHGGFLQPALTVPVVVPASDRVVAYLITLPGEDDYLLREHKGTLWHYHYLNSDEVRSDVILCWDTRQRVDEKVRPRKVRAIFQEKHGEGKSTFRARPDLWGDRKKQTMHQAAYGDLSRWDIAEFRCASNRAGPVWPLGAVLTPKPTIVKQAPKHPAKQGKARRR